MEKCSLGFICCEYNGWSSIQMTNCFLPSSNEDFYIQYNSKCSFESNSFQNNVKKSPFKKRKSLTSICSMNTGYLCGWCEQVCQIPLESTEV